MSENSNEENLEETNQESWLQTWLQIEDKIVYSWDENKDINEEIETSYLDYAMSVIVSRALPDVRDGLKPVHRRILYAMDEIWLRASWKYRKSATVVWDVLWKYHPHWDSSVYEAMVRLAQDFSMRYPLIDWQWNFWSMDWDAAAAMRYTEAKMTKLAEFMMSDIDKETIDWKENYDATRKEPSVLPNRLPNLLMNWVMWIAVGMATNIPSHNLWEIIDALEYLLKVPEIDNVTVEDLMEYIKWPDFPTGWIVYDKDALLQAYSTWRWSVIMRWVASIEENNKWRKIINISEVPYGLNKANFIMKIADLVKEKKIEGITDIRDESTSDWVRVIIDLRKDSFPKKILNQLYKLTPLQTSFGYNMISLWDSWKQPKLYNLKEILIDFIEHRKDVVTRRTRFELKVAEARAHILEWLKKALDHIDEIIATIKKSETKEEARINLMERFDFTEIQANAILEMQLSRLAWLERKKIEDELEEKLALIADLKDILSKPERVITIIIEELDYIKDNFADARRTRINPWKIWEFNAKDTIPNEEVVVVLTKNDYIKRIKASSFRIQKRWWKWITTGTKEDDEIQTIVPTKNHNDLLYFTSKWRVFSLPAYEVPETQRTAKWQAIVNLLSLQKDEEIAAILDITEEKNKYLFFVSNAWTVKKLEMKKEVKNIRSSWLIVLKIKEWEKLVWVKTTSWDDNILIATKDWKAIQFDEADVRPMWRAAAWVRWIKIKWSDEVVEVTIVWKEAKYLFIATENGMWKISLLDEYRSQWRWWSWVKAMNVTPKTWKIISAETLDAEDLKKASVLLMSKNWQTIKIKLSSVRVTWRVTQWVILTKIKWQDDILVWSSVVREIEEEEE